jgi:hypothetical protein
MNDTIRPDKELATARARAALRGIATRGPLTKTFPTLAAFLE